jgi:hypothetical protein
MSTVAKPLNRKAYGSIGHLPDSRLGPGDHKVSSGMARICCQRTRDRHDRVIVQEKLDGSCVAVAKIGGVLHPLGRAGWPAASSRHEQHRLFDRWVWANAARFDAVLRDGERIVGEWLAQAHGTRYALPHEPFVPFDIIRGEMERLPYDEFSKRLAGDDDGRPRESPFTLPKLLSAGPEPVPLTTALALVGANGHHGAVDNAEGVVYRIERHGRVDFLAKYVRPDKIDGCYLPEISGQEAVWNWRP